jgi:isoquinoline 1-oxidoreductase beta subunit
VKALDAEAARALPGVRAIFPIPRGVAVVAETTWQAEKARAGINVQWDDAAAVTTGTEALEAHYQDLARTPGTPVRAEGDAAAALAEPDALTVQATYSVPYLAHAPMEPLSAVARMTDTGIEVWAGAQIPTLDVLTIAEAAAVRPDQVTLHTVLAGGSFGRRANPSGDVLAEAAAVARGLFDQGIVAPIRLLWLREDDIRGGFYRPMAVHAVAGALDGNGAPSAWRHTVVCQSVLKGTPFADALMRDGIDPTAVEGVSDLPYAVPNVRADLHMPEPGIPALWWRSVGHSHTAFAVESFVDELAPAAKTDPLALRLDLLRDHPRLLGVLMLAAEKAGWGESLPKGRGRGIAVHRSFGSYVAQVADVTVTEKGFRVDRVVCAVDCGLPVNPDIIRAQIEGSVVFGLSAALRSRIALDETGRVEASNFHDYEVLRLGATPEIVVHIVPSTAPPTGIGEPGVPPVAPAVANALFAATGRRLRSLPLRLTG